MTGRTAIALIVLATASPAFAQTQVPAEQRWTGWAQCQITIDAPGYSHREDHLWTITGGGIKQANMEIYPTTWSVTGAGSLQRVSGPTQVSAQWSGNGTLQNVEIGVTHHLNRITLQRWTGHGPARSAFTGSLVRTTNGAVRSEVVILDVQQWAFPGVEGATTGTRMTGSNTMPFDGARGPMAPGGVGAMGSAACRWDFARGGGSPSSPPSSSVATPTTTPAPGGTVAGGVPSAGGSAGGGGAAAGGGSPGGSTSGGGSGGGNTGGAGTGAGAGAGGASGGSSIVAADLSIFPSEPMFGVPVPTTKSQGPTNYGFVVSNEGPAVIRGAVVRMPASAGASKTSVQCQASTVNFRAECPPGLTIEQLEAGVAIPYLDPRAYVFIDVRVTVTAAVGDRLTVTGTITPPQGVNDPNAANNSMAQSQTIVAVSGSTTPQPAIGGGAPAGGGATADLSITRSTDPPGVTSVHKPTSPDDMMRYVVDVTNNGSVAVNGAIVAVPQVVGLRPGRAAAGGQCPSRIPAGELESGLTLPVLPAGGSVRVGLAAFFSREPLEIPNVPITASVFLPTGVTDPNQANKSASMTQSVASHP